MTTRPALGYIGLGNMGGPMALRLTQAGFSLNVYGRNRERLRPALDAGAVACASPREVAERSDIVFTCLTDTKAVEDVVFAAGGLAEGARAGTRLVEMSTISPEATRAMATRLREQAGMIWIDAPVSGGTVGAAAGTLSIFLGGAAEDIAAVRPVLEHIGRNITHMGASGAGQTTKMINQIIVCVSVAMLAEACGLAERAGLDLAAVPKALAGGRADSAAMEAYWMRLAARDYTSLSTVTSMLKDIELIQSMGREVGAVLPLTSLVREYNQVLANIGHAGEDLTALARLFAPPVPDGAA